MDKVRLRFLKSGDLRLIGHHDLMRSFERLIRRADIPIKLTEGFHPTPRMIFALSLTLGVVGAQEVLELELTRTIEPADLLALMRRHAPPGIVFHSCERIEFRRSAQARRAVYRIPVPPDDLPAVQDCVLALLEAPECWVDRLKPRPRRVDVRPWIRGIAIERDAVLLDLWVTPQGTARLDEMLEKLGLPAHGTVAGPAERLTLEIHDELTPEQAALDGPPGPDALRSMPWLEPTPPTRGNGMEPALAEWGASPNGPMVE